VSRAGESRAEAGQRVSEAYAGCDAPLVGVDYPRGWRCRDEVAWQAHVAALSALGLDAAGRDP